MHFQYIVYYSWGHNLAIAIIITKSNKLWSRAVVVGQLEVTVAT